MKTGILLLLLMVQLACFSQDPVTCEPSDLVSNWNSVGPFYDDSYSNIGRVVSVWVSPDDPDYLLAGTRSSGIWRTSDGGEHWENLTNYQLPAVGIEAMAVHNNNTGTTSDDYIYASTRFNGNESSIYNIGIIYSEDGGSTWQYDYSMDSDPSLTTNPFIRTGDVGNANIVFKPDTYDLMIPNGSNIYLKNVISGDWVTFKNIDDFSTDANHGIKEIDFMPLDPNFIIISPIYGVSDDFRYTPDGGTTWTEMAVPIPYIPTGFELTSMMCSTTFPNSTHVYTLFKYLVKGDYDADPGTEDTEEAQTFFFKYRIIFGEILSTSYDIVDLGADDNLYESIQLEVFPDYLDYAFVARGQNTLYKAQIPLTGNITFFRASQYYGSNTHADIRSMAYYKNPVSSENYIVIGHDGGVSICDQKEMLVSGSGDDNDSKWDNINGLGFTISEFNYFSGSEFSKNRIFTSSPDGNSYIYIDEVFTNYPSLSDYTRALISPTNYNLGITNANGGLFLPATTYRVGLDVQSLYTVGFAKSAGVDDDEVEDNNLNWANRPMKFTKTGNLITGTMDVFQYDDLFASPITYSARSTNSYYMVTPLLPTKTPINALAVVQDFPDPGMTSFYYSTKDIKKADDQNKLVYSIYNPAGPIIFASNNRTPGAITDVSNEADFPSGENQIDHTWITDIVVNDNNPNELWISFGANRTGWEVTLLTENSIEKKGKVYFSDDGGITWSNRSTGLPNYPVHCLEYWPGSDDVIFAGTDVGIFVWNKYSGSFGEWECFNTGLPYCSVSNLEINNCTSTLRASTFGFGLWETMLPDISTSIEIVGDVTWAQSMDVYHDIVIKPGASLTILDCEIRMVKGGKIIVENGGKLIVDNATITNYCDFWKGIEVWGKGNSVSHPEIVDVITGVYPEDDSDHGVVYLRNNAKIESAETAISTYNSDYPTSSIYYGGIVVAHDSEFHNNIISLYMHPFDVAPSNTDDDNVSEFYMCSFKRDNQMPCETYVSSEVFLVDIDGVLFHACDFENTFSGCTDFDFPIGINSTNSTYTVESACDFLAEEGCEEFETSFSGYFRGIIATNTSPRPRPITINDVVFANNERAVLFSSILNSEIWRCKFEIPDFENRTGYGLYLEGCINYHVEGNYFTWYNDPGSATDEMTNTVYRCSGIFVENNHNTATEIYRNTFESIEIGVRSQGNNSKLQIRCNEFIDPIVDYDIIVTSGTLGNQGICNATITQPAGNQFSPSGAGESDFRIVPSGVSLNYRHHTEPVYIPVDYTTTQINLHNCGVSGAEDCVSTLPGGTGGEERMMMAEAADYQTAIDIELAKIDGGNTEEMIADIQGGGSQTEVKFALDEASPYISNDVLVALVNEEPLGTTDILDVMDNNYPISDTVAASLELSNYQVPSAVIETLSEDVVDNMLTVSAMSDLLATVSVLETKREYAVLQSINHLIDEIEIDSAIALVAEEPGDWARQQEVQILTSTSNYNEAKSALEQYVSVDQFGEDFKVLYTFINDIESTERTLAEITAAEESTLRSIASKETSAGIASQNILSLLYKEESYPEIIDEIPEIQLRLTDEVINNSNSDFKIYPNPADELIFVELKDILDCEYFLYVYDITGVRVLATPLRNDYKLTWIDIKDFQTGIYFFEVFCNGKSIGAEKVIVE